MHTDDITFKVTGRDAEKLNEFQKLHDGCLEGMAGALSIKQEEHPNQDALLLLAFQL